MRHFPTQNPWLSRNDFPACRLADAKPEDLEKEPKEGFLPDLPIEVAVLPLALVERPHLVGRRLLVAQLRLPQRLGAERRVMGARARPPPA
ncbi:hypothetical protein [Corallococcus sicarius]|uniref:hypothetical protein n=1 Tax=Corallococcus sicarius TaxID=2316726 RepID=UPI0011C41F88|nr:hypothetical protein [Corallococcus sicarius]